MNMNGYQTYQRNKYATASPHKLITMLYEGAIRFAQQAVICIEQHDIAGKSKYITKFQDIIYELISSLNLNEGREIADSLLSLYNYTLELSMRSSMSMDVVPLKEAITIITEIKTSWEQIGKEVQLNG